MGTSDATSPGMIVTKMIDAFVPSTSNRNVSLALSNSLRSKNFTKSLISGSSVVDSTGGAVIQTRDDLYVLAPGCSWNGEVIVRGVRNKNLYLIPSSSDDFKLLKLARDAEKAIYPTYMTTQVEECIDNWTDFGSEVNFTTFSGGLPTDWLLHQRFGHRSMKKVRKVFVNDLDKYCGTECTCHSCCTIKLKAATFKRTKPPTEYLPGERLDADDVPKRIRSKAGNLHTEFIIDYSTRRIFLVFLKSKAEVAEAIRTVKRRVETMTSRPVKVIQCDASPCNTTALIINDCKLTGTQLRTANPGDLKQNGFCERAFGNKLVSSPIITLAVYPRLFGNSKSSKQL